jgi:Asp-tRNA(Asn)/Glu-tRNA(Gln) amidotransferase A subunit family amidase
MRPRHLLPLAGLVPAILGAQASAGAYHVEETTITQLHAAFKANTLTCHTLVQQYLDRIAAYDKQGPAINAVVVLNPKALAIADSLDRRFKKEGLTGPLHCIPMIVKDNYETKDLQTTAGSLALKGWIPLQDATMVHRIREAGAIVLFKSNMAEWAFSPFETVNSILPGYTKNPYALDRVTAGSSGGTAAGVAANEGESGLGTDTGNSIRGPSAHNALVGIRSTMGLTSRAGVVPLSNSADIAGPMARTVADAVAIFNVVAGEDPDDSVTVASRGHREADYRKFLVLGGLKGSRIGVLRQAYERSSTDSDVVKVFANALEELKRQGATIVDPAGIDSLNAVTRAATPPDTPSNLRGCNRFKFDLERYLAARAQNAPVKTISQVLRSGSFHPSVQLRLQAANDSTLPPPEQNPGCSAGEAANARLRIAVLDLMDSLRLDALVYPTWSNPPRLIGDLNTPAGDNSQLFSPRTGFPAITVPMGYTRGNMLPAGMTFFGRPWSEAKLINLVYEYEQTTHHRRPPASAPPLKRR